MHMAFTARAPYLRTMPVLALLATGFLIGVGLIIAIGPQNAFILRQGIRRERILDVAIAAVMLMIAAKLAFA